MKSTIHRRVLRRKATKNATTHTRRSASGEIEKTWTQKALKCSLVMQAFRAEAVGERILRDPGSAHLLLWKHHRLLKNGRASKAPVKAQREETRSIADAYKKRAHEAREEGGEPPEAA